MKKDLKIERGLFLIAEPFAIDEFKRTVVLIADPDAEGTTGFILNKNTGLLLSEVMPSFPTFKTEVYYGGPVETDTLHYLHTLGDLLPDSLKVMSGVWWGGDFQQLKILVEQELVQPHQIRFYVGYSGWEPTQLEDEIENGSWVTEVGDSNFVFTNRPRTLWRDVLQHKSDTMGVIGRMPDDNFLN